MFAQLGSVLFLIHSPIRCPCSFTLNTVTVNCQSVLSCAGGLPADKWPGGEVQGEPCQSQSALCCCSNLRRCEGGGQREAETERERERRCSQDISLKSSFRSSNMHRLCPCSRHSIHLFIKMLVHQICLKRICKIQIIDAAGKETLLQ